MSSALAYLVLEAAYRSYQYVTLADRLFAAVAANASTGADAQSPYIFDVHAGYRYAANFVGQSGAPWYSHWRTNGHGHVSQFEYPQSKPPDEYRIAVIGDSFAANISNNVRWTELVEQQLNHSPPWRAAVAGKTTRVINFGVDGMGMVQFAAMVRHHVLAFEPDLIVVNFITDDILRRLRFMTVPDPSADRNERIRAYVATNYLDAIDWLRPYPELFAATIGQYFGMKAHLPLDARQHLAQDPAFKFASRAEALRASAAAMRGMLAASPHVLFVHEPMFQELAGWRIPEWDGLVQQLRKIVPEAPITAMQPRMEALLAGKRVEDRPDLAGLKVRELMALPEERRPELYRWFFLRDFHPTDYGTTLYAGEVARMLVERGSRPAGASAGE